MNKKFYTYGEILLALRDEYINNQELLTKLKRYVYIENGSWVDSYRFHPQFQGKNNEYFMTYPLDEKKLYLEVLERISFIMKTYEELFGCSSDRLITYHVTEQSDNVFSLEEKVRGNLVWFDPRITITDQKTFNELTAMILNSEFMNLQNERFFSLFDYRLKVLPEQLYLGNSDHWVRYDACGDKIDISNLKNSYQVMEFMKRPIAECYLNDRVKALVDKRYPEGKEIEIPEDTFGRNVSLNVIDTDKGIKLKKLKK